MLKPRVFFSRCLGFDRCRYNGVTILDPIVQLLKPLVEAIHECPEMAIGLGVPRQPIRIIEQKGTRQLVQPETGLDCTAAMEGFTSTYLDNIGEVDGFILKYRSPSCGMNQVKIYNSSKPNAGHSKGAGFFGEAVLERFPGYPIEDEGRLSNFDIRHHFLTHLFCRARFRAARSKGMARDLIAFHAAHKLLLMAYHQEEMRALGRLVAHVKAEGLEQSWRTYEEGFARALRRAPRRNSAINVLQHGFGYVSDSLTSKERRFFLETLDQYRQKQIPLSVPTRLLRSWILRFDVAYLNEQVYFDPYPLELVEVLDSGKGRAL